MRTRPAPVPRVRARGLFPKLIAARLRRDRPPRATLLCIYREPYRAIVLEMVRRAEASRWGIRLWALDETDSELAGHTVGHGPGGRFALLNRLAEGVDERDWLVISDDDTQIVYPWTLSTFLTICGRLSYDLAQPAHIWNSYHWTKFNEQHPGVLARDTTYVETGPVLAVSPRLRPRIMPFPESTHMGWGTDIFWSDFVAEGYRLGIVDAVPLEHLAPGGVVYDIGPEMQWNNALLAERGLTAITQLMETLHTHRWFPFRKVGSTVKP